MSDHRTARSHEERHLSDLAVTGEAIDISSTDFWRQPMRERDRAFAQLRAQPSVSFHPTIEMGSSGGPGFWAAVTHDDIRYVSRHADLFCSGRGVGFTDIPQEYNEPFGSFLMTDAPRHTHLRGLISRAFTPKRVRQIEDQIQRQATIIVADAVARGSGELVADLSMRLPLWTISEMLGVPDERRTELRDAANLMVGAQDPEVLATMEDPFTAVLTAGITMSVLGSEIAAERRTEPRDDLLTDLVQAEIDGQRLTDEEIGAFVVLLGVAGNDTTRNSITHGVLAFARNPDQWQLLRSDPERYLPTAVDEIVRWASPVLTFRRTATQDTHLGDQSIAEGDHIVMFYGSGNRDEHEFEEAWTFDITRTPNDHVGFGGGGVHHCLGANLAKAQLRSVFRELATRVGSFEVGEPKLLPSAFVHGIDSLDCTFVTNT
jgi:cytochrome P450